MILMFLEIFVEQIRFLTAQQNQNLSFLVADSTWKNFHANGFRCCCYLTFNNRKHNLNQLSYKSLEHATDAIFEVNAENLEDAFVAAAKSVIETILDPSTIEEKEEKVLAVSGKDLRYLLYNWLEELIILTITDGFAARTVTVKIEKNSEYRISAKLKGEKIDIKKHHFRVEIKAPTFHEMEIRQNGGIYMRYLLDL